MLSSWAEDRTNCGGNRGASASRKPVHACTGTSCSKAGCPRAERTVSTKFSAIPLPEQLRTSVSYKVTKPPRESLEPLTLELETASVCLSAPATCSAPRSYRAEKVPVTYTRSCEHLLHSCCNRPMSLHTCCYFCWGGRKNSN